MREESVLSASEDLWAVADRSVNSQFVGENPRFTDAEYRARRDEIAEISRCWRPGEPVPTIDYTDAEHQVWADICRELSSMHERSACEEFLAAKDSLSLPVTRIPQLAEVSERLASLSGFCCIPAPGLVPVRVFFGAYRQSCFYSTQFIRHHTMRLYTPEPDIVHELVGHGNILASPIFAQIYQLVGEAMERIRAEEALRFASQVFWSTLELGVVAEKGETKVYGAGILSSFGEMDAFRKARVVPMDLVAMGRTDYAVREYQSVLFKAESMAHLEDALSSFFASYDDNYYALLTGNR